MKSNTMKGTLEESNFIDSTLKSNRELVYRMIAVYCKTFTDHQRLRPPPPPRPLPLGLQAATSASYFAFHAVYLSAIAINPLGTTCPASESMLISSCACFQSSRVTKVIDSPVRLVIHKLLVADKLYYYIQVYVNYPARPVLPTRCTYSSMFRGKSKL